MLPHFAHLLEAAPQLYTCSCNCTYTCSCNCTYTQQSTHLSGQVPAGAPFAREPASRARALVAVAGDGENLFCGAALLLPLHSDKSSSSPSPDLPGDDSDWRSAHSPSYASSLGPSPGGFMGDRALEVCVCERALEVCVQSFSSAGASSRASPLLAPASAPGHTPDTSARGLFGLGSSPALTPPCYQSQARTPQPRETKFARDTLHVVVVLPLIYIASVVIRMEVNA